MMNLFSCIWELLQAKIFAKPKQQEHDDLKACCKDLIDEAIKIKIVEKFTMFIVFFHYESPPKFWTILLCSWFASIMILPAISLSIDHTF